MRRDLISTATGMLALTLLLGILFPLAITGISQVAFPGNANGQQIFRGGKLVGSPDHRPVVRRPGHSGTARSCWTRTATRSPSPIPATSRPARRARVPPTTPPAARSPTTAPTASSPRQALAANLSAYLALERPYDPGLTVAALPVDAVDTSASGVDPDISPANADIQAHRVAAVRHLSLARVHALISAVHPRSRPGLLG